MVSSSKSHYPSRRSRRTAAVIATSLLTSSVSPVTAFAQDPVKDANNFVQGLAGNLPQAPAMPGLPAASPPANGGTETKPSDTNVFQIWLFKNHLKDSSWQPQRQPL